ncbi:Di-copper centre-containing protein [Rhizoctonia solani]|uniref:Di-copper centre-containing protein n=1 Tax=Rhizoctonia solani TaxID=456999 RepID=A0A8H7M7A9_9AGAM|nr:Di-copper centre-containing protein [Rhizoctonia solani]
MKFSAAFSLSILAGFVAAAKPAQTCPSLEVRREWRTFSKAERKGWIDAVNCLNKKPRTGKLRLPVDTESYSEPQFHIAPLNESSTYYDDLVYIHMNLNRTFILTSQIICGILIQVQPYKIAIIHWTGLFLPWHRAYLHEWTNILRRECNYKGVVPYWAWEKDSDDFLGSSIWDNDTESGLGGFSDDASDDYTVHTGALDIQVAYPVPHKLRRHYTPFPFGPDRPATSTFTPAEVEKLLSQPTGNFTLFHGYLEQIVGMHSAIHVMMGGDMGTVCPAGTGGTRNCPVEITATFSANEPMFHLHHGNVDRLWWLWQEKAAANKYAFHGGSIQNTTSLNEFPMASPVVGEDCGSSWRRFVARLYH